MLRAARLSRAPMAALAAIGLLWGGFAGVVPDLKAQTGASDAGFGLALLCSSLGAMTAMVLAPRIGQRLVAAVLPVFGLATVPVVLLPVVLPAVLGRVLPSLPPVAGLALALLLTGLTVALLDISANVRISALEARHRLHLMSVNHAIYSTAFALAAGATALARRAGWGPGQIQPCIALAVLVLVLAMRDRRGPELSSGDAGTGTAGVPWLAVALTGLVLFAAFVGENATEAWSALLIERTLGAAAGLGSLGPFALGLTMALGRFGGQALADRLGELRLILASACLGILGALALAVAPSLGWALAGVVLLAAGMAAIVPCVNSMLGRAVGDAGRALAMSRAWMVGMTGFFLGPALVGGIAQLSSLRWSFVAVAALVALSVPAVLRLARVGR